MRATSIVSTIAAFIIGTGLTAFFFLSQESEGQSSSESGVVERPILYWVAPMDPNFRRPEPGKSPMGMDLVPVYDNNTSATAGDGSNTVIVDNAMLQNLGVRTAPVQQRALSRTIRTVGYVTADESLISHVHVRAEGWIEKLPVKAVGELVSKGQPLFELYAPDIHVAQGEFAQFLKRGETDMLNITLSRLDLLGVPETEIEALRNGGSVNRRTSILSPMNGVVLSLNVGEGMFVKPEMTTMVVADLSSVWVLADIYEDQASWVKRGQSVDLKLDYQPDVVRAGTVDYIYPTLDAKTRTLTARLKFENRDGALKPNMFADVQIQTEPTDETLVIPVEGLIRTGVSNRVVVSLGGGRFNSVEVWPGRESEGYVEILEGLSVTDRVVVSGQFLIDSESNVSAAIRRMDLNDPETPAPGLAP